ncbi:SDR family NAD(P)-dependent oxidoreductase [Skermania piniformis]|uniref:SDR family NAD(P)-dependent oxidoreductase n=1 Tax=Skermania pinensis TaxID=39122 RepID=A0ABX8S9X5_9ACTN|nr:SDR family NAD(P)-dependent oxidoreductase [Skermania piniformis]QXQ14654.1 SDR family NAD(P)-dependent oxidoreductase [Skermania piniformis]
MSSSDSETDVAPARPVALVTGATSGLGKAFATELAGRGYDLVLVGRNAERLADVAGELERNHGALVEQLVADLEQESSRARVVARLSQGVTALVNNAGYGNYEHFWTTDIEVIRAEMAVNITAVLEFTRAAVPPMLAADNGMIINVASISGLYTGPAGTYAAEKAWVIRLSEGLAHQLQSTGVRVQALCPGFMETPFIERAGIEVDRVPKQLLIGIDEVVKTSLGDIEKGWVVSVPGRRIKFLTMLNRHSPRRRAWKIGV